MSKQHTPGPWLVCTHTSYIEVRPGEGAPICEIATHDSAGPISDPDQDRANARLLAAAPDLLAALQAMVEDYRSEGCPDPICGVCKRSKAAKDAALAAIAKAEGRA